MRRLRVQQRIKSVKVIDENVEEEEEEADEMPEMPSSIPFLPRVVSCEIYTSVYSLVILIFTPSNPVQAHTATD